MVSDVESRLKCLSGLAACLVVFLLAFLPVTATAGPTLEAAVKATYLYKFAPFVTWPAPADNTQPFTICIVGEDPFGAQLDRAIAGQSYNDRPFQIARVDTVGPQSTCNIAYLGGSPAQSITDAMQAVHGVAILTVTDEGNPPGMIAFAMQDGHVRFRVDQDAAQGGGLTISSKLLSLAISVKSTRDQGQP